MFDKAIEIYETGGRCVGDTRIYDANIGVAHARAGRYNDARSILEKLEENSQQLYGSVGGRGGIYWQLGEKEKSLKLFNKAIDDRDPNLLNALRGPWCNQFASDPDYQALLKRMNLD